MAAPLSATRRDPEPPGTHPVWPTVVLLHGVFMAASLWDAVVPRLTGLPVLRVDLPSHGASPDLAPGAGIEDHVEAVAATHRASHPQDAVDLRAGTRRMGRRRVRQTLRSVLLEPGDVLDVLPGLPVARVIARAGSGRAQAHREPAGVGA